jgi:hypothetical protein
MFFITWHVTLFYGNMYEGVSKSTRIGRLERELQMIQLSATRYSCIAILWVSLVSSAAITLCVASQWVFVVVYFVIDWVRKLSGTPSYFQNLSLMVHGQVTDFLVTSTATSTANEGWSCRFSHKIPQSSRRQMYVTSLLPCPTKSVFIFHVFVMRLWIAVLNVSQ